MAAESSEEDGLKAFHIYAVGERDAMSVNMRNAGLESLNEKYMVHLRNTMRREVSLISMDQRSLLNKFKTYSMTMVEDSMAPSRKDRRTYLQFLKEEQQQNQMHQGDDGFGPPDPVSRSRTFIESQRRSGTPDASASLARLRLLTRPSRQASICPRLAAAPVTRVHPEFAPSLDRSNRARTAPTPQTLLRMHYQRVEQQDAEDPDGQQQQPQQQRLRRVHSTLGFSVNDARSRRRALSDGRFLRLREALQKVPQPSVSEQLRQEDL